VRFSSQPQQKTSYIFNENSYRSFGGHQEKTEYETKNSMSESEHGANKRDMKRTTNGLYKQLNAAEFLAKTQAEIRQEFRKMPNPPAKDAHAAK
jgi:hypothetical protein